MRALHCSILALSLLTACGGAETTPPAPAAEAAPRSGECSGGTDCASCLAQSGCSWTGGQCATECLMDTYCVGPANPSAPACLPSVDILGGWQEDMRAAVGYVRVFVRDTVDLGPARFRRTMRFVDATESAPPAFVTNVLASNDAHGTTEGTWRIEGSRLTVQYTPPGASEETIEVYEIVEVDADTLKLREVRD